VRHYATRRSSRAQRSATSSSLSRFAINLDRITADRALPIVNSALTKRGPREAGDGKGKGRPVPLVRSEHDDIRTGPEKTSLSTWKPARTERANDSESDIIFDEAHDAPVVGRNRGRSPFSRPRAKIRISLAPPSRGPSRAGPLVSPLPSGARRRLARKAASRRPLNAI